MKLGSSNEMAPVSWRMSHTNVTVFGSTRTLAFNNNGWIFDQKRLFIAELSVLCCKTIKIERTGDLLSIDLAQNKKTIEE